MPPDDDRLARSRAPGLRQTYLAAAQLVVDLVAHPAVVAAWEDPSSLPGMTVGELAAHVGRSVLQVEGFLDGPDPGWAQPITAGRYYAVLQDTTDLESALNVGVRQRAVEVAVNGPDGVLAMVSACRERLAERLSTEPDAPVPQPAAEAVTAAVDVLVAAARERHGDHAVMLALARREHDLVEALRVL